MNCRYGPHFLGIIEASCSLYDPISDTCSSDARAKNAMGYGLPAACFKNMKKVFEEHREATLCLLEKGIII